MVIIITLQHQIFILPYTYVIRATSTKSYVSRARPTHEISKCKNFVHFSSLCIGHMSIMEMAVTWRASIKNAASVSFIYLYTL